MINALLVRWAGGWGEVHDDASIAAHGRREALLGLGAVQSAAEMERIARGQLAIYANTRTEITADLDPYLIEDTPYLGFRPGDTITVPDWNGTPVVERVIAVTVAEDENGQVTYSPELKDLILTHQERLEQGLKKMSDGSLRGDSPVASPAAFIPVPKRHPGGGPAAAGLVVTTTNGPAGFPGFSEPLHSTPAGTTLTLASFKVNTTTIAGPGETVVVVQLWQLVAGGDGNIVIAECSVDYGASPGEFIGTIYDPVAYVEGDYGLKIEMPYGALAFTATVTFNEPGPPINLEWNSLP